MHKIYINFSDTYKDWFQFVYDVSRYGMLLVMQEWYPSLQYEDLIIFIHLFIWAVTSGKQWNNTLWQNVCQIFRMKYLQDKRFERLAACIYRVSHNDGEHKWFENRIVEDEPVDDYG